MGKKVSAPSKKAALSSKSHIIITITIYIMMLSYAMSVTMLGPLMPDIIEQYMLKLSEAGLISTFQNIGGVIFTILGGIFADFVKKSRLIGITFFAYSISLLAIAFAPAYAAILALFFLVGASTRMLDVLLNAFIADINPHRRGFHLTILGIFFSIGALLGPLFSLAIRTLGIVWHNTFLILGLACTLISIVYMVIIKKIKIDEKASSRTKSINYLKLLSSPNLLLLCLITLIFTGYQAGISIWTPMYMEEFLFARPLLASSAVSLFYIGIILGRTLYSIVLGEHHAKKIISIGSFLGAVILIFGILVKNSFWMYVTSGISGFLTCAVFPLALTLACNYYPENSGAVSSIIILSSVISWMVFPWLIGIVADNTSLQTGMMINGAALILTFLLALALPSAKGDT